MRVGNSLSNFNGCLSGIYAIKGQLRIVMNNSVTFAVKPGADMREVGALREKIRQKCNVIFLFMRQRMREARVGFHPATKMKDAEFNAESFINDPCLPLAKDLLNAEDAAYYAAIPVNQRPIAVECELQQLASRLALHLTSPGEYVSGTHAAVNSAMGALTSIMTIVTGGALPYMYVHMVKVFMLLFCYLTPVLYVAGDLDAWKITATLIIIIGYYGIDEVATRMVDPIGWSKSDIDPEPTGIGIERLGNLIMADAENETNQF
jgi:hypothetical protein